MPEEDHLKLRLVRLQPSEAWSNHGQREDEFSFVFLKGGVGKYVTPSTTQRLVPGNIVVFNGYSGGKLYADEKGACVFTNFSLLLEHLFPLFASREIALLHTIKGNFKAARIYSQSSTLAAECQQLLEVAHTQSSLEQRANLLRIVAAILAEELKSVHRQRSGENWAENHMIDVFEKLPSAELLSLTVDELAAKFGCSRRHLNRLFHQHFGLSITGLRMEIRLLKAVYMLRNPGEKVINVADRCGFSHLGLFNTCFKRRYGTTPGQWRKAGISSGGSSARKSEARQTCPLQANGLCPWGGQSANSGQVMKAQASGRTAKVSGELGDSSRGESVRSAEMT